MVAVMINGQQVPQAEAQISVMDHGFLFGDMVYEVVKAHGNELFAVRMHLQRLRYSAAMVDLPIPWDDAFLVAEMRTMLGLIEAPHSYLRLVVTRGEGPLSLEPDRCGELTRVLYGKELTPLNNANYREGVAVWVCRPIFSDQGNIKSSVYRNHVQAIKQARSEGYHEAVLLDRGGMITECTTSNIFWVKDEHLYTPALNVGILKGVTRQAVLHLAGELNLAVREGIFPLAALLAAEEVFITSTTRDVMPVSRVGEQQIYPVGQVTRSLMDGFSKQKEIDLDWSRT